MEMEITERWKQKASTGYQSNVRSRLSREQNARLSSLRISKMRYVAGRINSWGATLSWWSDEQKMPYLASDRE